MNAVYQLGPRLQQARDWGKETLAGGELNNKQFNDYVPDGSPLTQLSSRRPRRLIRPGFLKTGPIPWALWARLNRVYLNIGLFSEEWLLHFNPLGRRSSDHADRDRGREQELGFLGGDRSPDSGHGAFFLKTTAPHLLKDAPAATNISPRTAAVLNRGKVVFAENCARCHSSKLPDAAPGLDPGGCSGKDYLGCWDKYWAWTKTDDFKSKMRAIVLKPDFLTG